MLTRFVLIGFLLWAATPGSAQIILDNFDTLRNNGAGAKLWQATDNPNQSISIEDHDGDKRLKITVSQDGFRAFSGEIIGFRAMFLPVADATRFPYPGGFLQGQIESGSWIPTANRMEMWMKCSKNIPTETPYYTMNIGTYVKSHSASPYDMGPHYYHFFHPNFYANRWMKVTMNATPTHKLSTDANTNWPPDPSFTSDGVHYFDGLTVFYISIPTTGIAPYSCWIDDVKLFQETGAADDKIRGVTATYSGSKYELSWNALKNSSQVYEVRYSPTSMKANGFTSGTDGGTRSAPGIADSGVLWSSPAISENPNGMYFAIRPSGGSAFTEIYLPRYPSSGSSTQSPCDLDSNGTVSQTDVDFAIQAAIGSRTCTADLDGNGRCDVVDSQRVVNASLGGACKTGL